MGARPDVRLRAARRQRLIFLAPGTEAQVVQRCAAHRAAGGVVVAGFRPGDPGTTDLAGFDALFADQGLALLRRYADWQGAAYTGGEYAVSVWGPAGPLDSLAGMSTLSEPVAARRLLLVHAHPDDETIGTGATMAHYAATGARVTLVTCTLGEEGEVLVPDLADLAADRTDGLGRHRIGELAKAMDALGVTDHRFLGGPGRFRDSGMVGTPANERPDCFWRAPADEAVGPLVGVIREVRPQVVVTYDPFGGYGHPDHIQAHRVTELAVTAAADARLYPEAGPAWAVAKLYWTAVPRSVLAAGIEAMREAGSSMFEGVESVDDLPMGVADDLVTTAVDARDQLPAKIAAMRAHATQIAVDGPFFALSDNIGQMSFAREHFILARGRVAPAAGGREDDLFAGVGVG